MYKELINTASKEYPFLIEHDDVRYIPHFHEEAEIVYVLDGELEITVGTEKRTAAAGEISVIFPNVIHNLYTHEKSHSFVIKLYPMAELSKISAEDFIITKDDACYDKLNRYIQNIILENRTRTTGYELAVNVCLDSIFLLLLRELRSFKIGRKQKQKNVSHNAFLSALTGFLEENYQNEVNLDLAARHFGYTRSYFCRYFRKVTALTFWDYYTMFRIEKAGERIRDMRSENVIETASRCGFKNVRSFNEAFKRYYGCTPMEYRKSMQKERQNANFSCTKL
jgi:xylan 1,4-beta-xylosidase